MNDILFYCACGGILLGVILAAARDVKGPGCAGSCDQGRKACNCKGDANEPV